MNATGAAILGLIVFLLGSASFVLGMAHGRYLERERIRNRIVTDQTTCDGDYCAAEAYADRMVRP